MKVVTVCNRLAAPPDQLGEMLSCALFGNPIFLTLSPVTVTVTLQFKKRAFLNRYSISANLSTKSQVHHDSLRVLEWDKLCDSVASFARTSLGREATKVVTATFHSHRYRY